MKKRKKKAYSWDQLPEEPDAAYARFLVYRNLGPCRSIDSASAISEEAAKGGKKRRAGGIWWENSSLWNWKARAEAWDVFVLVHAGERVVTRFIAALEQLSSKVLTALGRDDVGPESWEQVLESFGVLSEHVTPEAVQRVATGSVAQPGSETP